MYIRVKGDKTILKENETKVRKSEDELRGNVRISIASVTMKSIDSLEELFFSYNIQRHVNTTSMKRWRNIIHHIFTFNLSVICLIQKTVMCLKKRVCLCRWHSASPLAWNSAQYISLAFRSQQTSPVSSHSVPLCRSIWPLSVWKPFPGPISARVKQQRRIAVCRIRKTMACPRKVYHSPEQWKQFLIRNTLNNNVKRWTEIAEEGSLHFRRLTSLPARAKKLTVSLWPAGSFWTT